ncbi:MAG: DUF839 domain-containing protein [Opitutaceae bacterium]
MNSSRRRFLKQSALITLGFTGLGHFAQRMAAAGSAEAMNLPGYGPLLPDPKGILDLPGGFTYRIISKAGDIMTDGLLVPKTPDGMGAFAGTNGRTILVRNHENGADPSASGAFGKDYERLSKIEPEAFYDYGNGRMPGLGGTTTLVYDSRSERLVTQFLSLAGTYRNCAGGITPWNTWISCEEAVTLADRDDNIEKDHGYNFEVPVTEKPHLADPIPLTAMGRFNHEAVCVDPSTGIVYQTEDRPDGLITRFIPNTPGRLINGGRLQALAIKGDPSRDTRNWEGLDADPFPLGTPFDVEWIDLEEIDAPKDDLRYRGFDSGAARFARGEGMWFGKNEVYFACTNGGAKLLGQIFRYRPSPREGTDRESNQPGTLELFVEPNDGTIIENADNLTVSPWGDVVVCEDGGGDNFLVGIRPNGDCYQIARNATGDTELAGVCFSPVDGTLFVNLQGPGLTLAITGPWQG